MRFSDASLARFMAKYAIDRRQLVTLYVLATGYRASFPMLLRAFVQGRSVAGRMAGRARIVPVVSVAEGRAA